MPVLQSAYADAKFDAEGRRHGSGIHVAGGEPAPVGVAEGVAQVGADDRGVPARHVVTELRQAHGSVRAAQGKDPGDRRTDFHRGAEAGWNVQSAEVSAGTSGGISISAR